MTEPVPYAWKPSYAADPLTSATPMEMLARALQSNAAPETLEKLLALQERWERNMARKAFDRAMAAAKSELKPIKKTSEVSHGAGKTNYMFADLAEIERSVAEPLAAHGLYYRFRTTMADKIIVVTCIVSHQDGHSEENSLPGPADVSGAKNAIQAIGSTVTYLSRYTLVAALGLSASKDDDGVAAGNGKEEVELLNSEQMDFVWQKAHEYCDPEVEEEWVKLLVKTLGHDNLADVPASLFEMLRQKIIAWPKSRAAAKWKTT